MHRALMFLGKKKTKQPSTCATTVFIAGGKTGGHLFPGIAMAQHLQKTGHTVHFLSPATLLDQALLHHHRLSYFSICAHYPSRFFSWHTLKCIIHIIIGTAQACHHTVTHKPHTVIGLGGYPSVPGVLAGALCRKKIILMEQNIIPGRATHWLLPLAHHICVSFDATLPLISKKHAHKVTVTGNPIRHAFYTLKHQHKNTLRKKHGLPTGKPILLTLGGSQGSHAINHVVSQTSHLLTRHFHIIHITGKAHFQDIRLRYQHLAASAITVLPFSDCVHELMYCAVIVISRAGATTLSELLYLGKKAVLIPFAQATNHHQLHNARYLEKQGLAVILQEKHLSAETLIHTVQTLFAAPKPPRINRRSPSPVSHIATMI